MKLTNKILLHNEYAEIIASNGLYKHSVLLDIEDISKVGKVRISNQGYAYQAKRGNHSVASVVMDVQTNIKHTYIDHINGNTLDNRKINLRICSPSDNSRNRHSFSRNNTGVVGISYKKNGVYEYYRVSLTNQQGVRYTKQFNINKLGKEAAFKRATSHLLDKKREFGYVIQMRFNDYRVSE